MIRRISLIAAILLGSIFFGQTSFAKEGEIKDDDYIEIDYDNSYLISDDFIGGNTYYILHNGDLWKTYPELKKAKSNVKCYQGGEIITIVDGEYSDMIYQYALDYSGNLWDGNEQIASDIVKFTGNYALSKNGMLIDLYYGLEAIPGVKDWHDETESSPQNNMYIYTGDVYVLKNDQTLWCRKVEIRNGVPTVIRMEQVKENVLEISATSVLCADGKIYNYADLETPVAENGASLTELGYTGNPAWREPLYAYYGTDGNLYVVNPETDRKGYFNLGQIDVVQICIGDRYAADEGQIDMGWYILTREGNLLRCDSQGTLESIAFQVKELNSNYSSQSWLYRKNDGLYYNEYGELLGTEEPLVLERYYGIEGTYKLVSKAGSNDAILVNESQNDDPVLDQVVKVFGDPKATYVLRKDGTIWNVTGEPAMVLDLQNPPEAAYIRGDADGDGEPGISDLRLVLRHVCGKVTLEGTAYKAADVTDDGTVGIDDLRKILRYVCGKIEEL